MTTTTPAGYVVVAFGSGPSEGWCELSHCPMEAFGPFATNDEAKAFAATLPEWQQAHTLWLATPDFLDRGSP